MTVAALAGPTTAPQKVRGFVADKTSGQPVPGVVVCLEARLEDTSAIVGMLITDQAGYVSFALTGPLPQGVQKLCVYPFGDQSQSIDWLPNLGTALHFLLRVSPKLAVPEASRPSFVSIQRPDAVDWELSPFSFASRSSAVLGEGGCQDLLPDSSAERELHFQRVVRFSPPIGDSPPPIPGIVKSVDVTRNIVPDTQSATLKLAQVLEFRQQWFPVGHSLGQIVYSLALAPGESVDIAVIEWSRSDTAARQDTVTETEQLLHQQTHDRGIEESVNAALNESQGGWSLLGGTSTASAASGSATIPIYGIPVNLSATGSMLSAIGGGISQSWGNRNVAADSLQDIHDRVTQATSVYRSLNSTVVVQSTQREQNLVQTRTVVNHNHCHALTVEYYEVLRNFRVRTEFVRRRPVVLVPYAVLAFQWDTALRFRTILENVLLDTSLADCFDAMARLHLCPQIYTQPSTQASIASAGSSTTGTASPTPVKQGPFQVYKDAVDTNITINAGDTVQLVATGQVDFSPSTFGQVGKFDADGNKGQAAPTDGKWPAGGLTQRSLIYKVGSSDWMQGGTNITLPTSHPSGLLVLSLNDDDPGDNKPASNDPGWNVDVWVTPASGSSNTGNTGGSTTSSSAPSQVEDTCCENRLLSHLNGNIGFYNRAIWLLQDALERRVLLDDALSRFPMIRDGIEDRPIAVDGNYVAYAWNDPKNATVDDILTPVEGIVSLPTRGLFAEAQLGNCNACEVRDVTRFWNWQESPIPESAPAIQGVTPGPKGQPEPVPQPTTLPAPVVQISQPLQEPNPIGLAAALSLLGTPNLFRDMSGLTQVSKLLDGLTSGALTLAQAQDMARKAKPQVSAIGSGSGIGSTSAVRPQTPADLYDKLQVVRNAKDQGLLPPSAAQEAAMQYFRSDTTPAEGIIPASYTPGATGGSTVGTVTRPSPTMISAIKKLTGWCVNLGSVALASEDQHLGDALADAAVAIAKQEIENAVSNAISDVPFGKALKLALRYSLVFADGAGQIIDSSRDEIQKIVDEGATFSDDVGPDAQRVNKATSYMVLGLQRVRDALEAGLEAVVNDILNQAKDLLGQAAAEVTSAITGKIAAKLLKVAKIDRIYEMVATKVGNNVPAARLALYGGLSRTLIRQLIATAAGTPTQRARLEALVPGTASEDPPVALLRGLLDIGLNDLSNHVFPLADVFGYIPDDADGTRQRLSDIAQYEAKMAAHSLIQELQQTWTFVKDSGVTSMKVDKATNTIALPNNSDSDELLNGPTLPAGELGLLEDDLATDEGALAAVYDGLDTGIVLRAAGYQADIDGAVGGAWTAKLEEGIARTQNDSSEATSALYTLASALVSRYANTPLATDASAALYAVPLTAATLRPPPGTLLSA